jgi:uncharacterized membrane protein
MMEGDEPDGYYNNFYCHRWDNLESEGPISKRTALQWKRACDAEIEKRGLMLHDMGHGWTSVPFGFRDCTGLPREECEEEYKKEKYQHCALLGGKRQLFGDFDIKDGILILKGMPDDYKRYFLFYFIGICFISYLVCQFGFKESIVVTANSFDKYLLIFTGILVLIWGWNIDTPPNEILTWVKRIAVVCVAVTFGFTVIQNLPNPLYILLGVLAKLFVLVVIILAIMIIIAIFFVVLVFTIVSSRNNDNDNNSETWEFHYDEYLDKIIATRRN